MLPSKAKESREKETLICRLRWQRRREETAVPMMIKGARGPLTVVRVKPEGAAPRPNSKNEKMGEEGSFKSKNVLLPHLSLAKPSWVVRTESNVRKETRKKPDPPCVICQGTGRVDCYHCCGKGRTNSVHLAMLPKGEWPKWCRNCGGSGLSYCSRCLGTGEYRYIMGFHFMMTHSDHSTKDQLAHQSQENPGPHIAADDQFSSNHIV